jgi:hypothetical protein
MLSALFPHRGLGEEMKLLVTVVRRPYVAPPMEVSGLTPLSTSCKLIDDRKDRMNNTRGARPRPISPRFYRPG